VKKEAFNQTGPVQFGWAHSLHPVETKYVQGTVVMPSEDVKATETGEEGGKGQGTIWTSYTLPFAVFIMPGVINATIGKDTGLSASDVDLLLEALWLGTLHRQARGRGLQQPVFMLHVEYDDPFFRLGYLEDYVKLEPERDVWLGGNPPTALTDVSLDVTKLADVLNGCNRIARVRSWVGTRANIIGDIPGEVCNF
jgi:CRISPR-associated protein Csh2